MRKGASKISVSAGKFVFDGRRRERDSMSRSGLEFVENQDFDLSLRYLPVCADLTWLLMFANQS